jgi:hypothetical protein
MKAIALSFFAFQFQHAEHLAGAEYVARPRQPLDELARHWRGHVERRAGG